MSKRVNFSNFSKSLLTKLRWGVELCGKHPFVTGLFAILSFSGFFLSVVDFNISRDESESSTTQVARVEEKIDEIDLKISGKNKNTMVLGQEKNDIAHHWEHLRYSFTREEYVNPLIVSELLGGIADSGETVTQVNLVSGNDSNRFHVDQSVRQFNDETWIFAEFSDGSYFGYTYVGTSPSGIHILKCMENTGGRSIFNSILLLSFNTDYTVSGGRGEQERRQRIMLKSLGSIGLGDRYEGVIEYENRTLKIGSDESVMKHGQRFAAEEVVID